MPPAPAPNADNDAAQREITNALASLAAGVTTTSTSKRRLSGPERAAVLMLALGEHYGSKVWSMLDDDELRQISIVMSTNSNDESRELLRGLGMPFKVEESTQKGRGAA